MLDTRISKLIEILPDVLHDKPDTEDQCRAALSHMLSKLLECADATVPVRYLRLTRLDQNAFKTDMMVLHQLKVKMRTELVEEGARIHHIHASAYGSFMRTIEEMARAEE